MPSESVISEWFVHWLILFIHGVLLSWRQLIIKKHSLHLCNPKNQTWLSSSSTLWCFVSLSSIALEICFLKYLLPKNLLPKGCSGKSLNGDKCHRTAKISLPQWYTMYCRVYSNINLFSFLSSFKWIQENWDPVNAGNIITCSHSFPLSFQMDSRELRHCKYTKSYYIFHECM